MQCATNGCGKSSLSNNGFTYTHTNTHTQVHFRVHRFSRWALLLHRILLIERSLMWFSNHLHIQRIFASVSPWRQHLPACAELCVWFPTPSRLWRWHLLSWQSIGSCRVSLRVSCVFVSACFFFPHLSPLLPCVSICVCVYLYFYSATSCVRITSIRFTMSSQEKAT